MSVKQDLTAAIETAREGKRPPAVILMAASAHRALEAEIGYVQRFMDVPIRVMWLWQFGWELLDQQRAAHRGLIN